MLKEDQTPFGSVPSDLPEPEPVDASSDTPDSMPDPQPAPAPMPGGIAPEGAPEEYEASFEIAEDEFKEMPAGTYDARLIKVESKKSQAGNPMYAWTYVITKGEHQGEEMMNFTAITPAAMWKLKETLVALGIKPTNGVYSFKPSEVLNKEVLLEVVLQEYQNQERPSIDKVLPLGSR